MTIDPEGVELARQILNAACGTEPEITDLEGAVVRSLALLTFGKAAEFCQYEDPPRDLALWLTQAEIEPVRGLLMSTLRRWHELQRQVE